MTHPTCATCTRPMRPHNTLAIDYPGTVATHNTHTCRTCEARYRRTGVTTAVAAEQIDAGDRWNLLRPDRCGDDSFFLPIPDHGRGIPDYTVARAICAACPVRELSCKPFILRAETGMTAWARDGFVAGMTPGERAKADPTRVASKHPIKHGTEGGASAHRRREEPTCDACKEADMLAGQKRRAAAAEKGRANTAKCGTTSGAQRHRALGEEVCRPCKDATASASRKAKARRIALGLTEGLRANAATCGTPSGAQAHRRRDEVVCEPCRAAGAEYSQLRRDRAKDAQEAAA